MSRTIHSAGCVIDTYMMQVTRDGEVLSIRPKTLQLLLLLVDNAGEIVSKEQILASIWDDVLVDEQVIFQSIKELRKVFVDINIIKTVPRKGYCWIMPIEVETDSTGCPPVKHRSRWLFPGIAMVIMLIASVALIFGSDRTVPTGVKGSVLILPIRGVSDAYEQQWLRYGGMDHLIQRLRSTDETAVLQTDYVLEVMARADMQVGEDPSVDIPRLFNVSGANLVVDIAVSGSPGDYHFVYHLYQRHILANGGVVATGIFDGLNDIANIVAQVLGQNTLAGENEFHSAFENQLLVSALTNMYERPDAAMTFLQAAITASPTNLTATRLALQLAMMNGKQHVAQQLLDGVMPLVTDSPNHIELVRIMFFAAALAAQQGQFDIANEKLSSAQQLARVNKDWLYLAYINELKGQLAVQQGDYSAAKEFFNQSLTYHDIMQCPLGRSNSLLFLSKLAYQQKHYTQALTLAEQASGLVQNRGLEKVNEAALDWHQHLLHLDL